MLLVSKKITKGNTFHLPFSYIFNIFVIKQLNALFPGILLQLFIDTNCPIAAKCTIDSFLRHHTPAYKYSPISLATPCQQFQSLRHSKVYMSMESFRLWHTNLLFISHSTLSWCFLKRFNAANVFKWCCELFFVCVEENLKFSYQFNKILYHLLLYPHCWCMLPPVQNWLFVEFVKFIIFTSHR